MSLPPACSSATLPSESHLVSLHKFPRALRPHASESHLMSLHKFIRVLFGHTAVRVASDVNPAALLRSHIAFESHLVVTFIRVLVGSVHSSVRIWCHFSSRALRQYASESHLMSVPQSGLNLRLTLSSSSDLGSPHPACSSATRLLI